MWTYEGALVTLDTFINIPFWNINSDTTFFISSSTYWKGNELISVTRFFGNNDNVKLYLGSNPETNMYELWLGLIGLDGDGSEFIIQSRESIDLDSKTVETLPSYLKVISIS